MAGMTTGVQQDADAYRYTLLALLYDELTLELLAPAP
jgi:hypothetical protein